MNCVILMKRLVPRRRLELPRPCGHRYLKPARLPIPPPGHSLRASRSGPGRAVGGRCNPAPGQGQLAIQRFGHMAAVARLRASRPMHINRWTRQERTMATRSVATVFGGSGFIGRYVVKRLAHKGFGVRVAVRDPEAALFLKPSGAVGQIVPLFASVENEATVHRAVDGAGLVVNLVGI